MQSILIFLILLILFSLVYVDSSDHYMLVFVSLIYFVTLFFILEIKMGEMKPLLLLFVFYSIIFMGLRLCHLNYHVNSIRFGELVNIEDYNIVFTIFMLWLSTIFLTVGLKLGGRYKVTSPFVTKFCQLSSSFPVISERFLFGYAITLLPLSWILALWVNRYHTSYWVNIVSILLGYMAVFYLFIGYCVLNWDRFSVKKQKLVFFYAVLFLVMRVLVGSKGGIHQLILGILMAMMIIKPNFIFSFKLLFKGICLIPFAVILYVLGQQSRFLVQTFVYGDISLSAYLNVFNSILSDISIQNFVDYFNTIIVQSFAMLDYLNVLYNNKPVNGYLGLGYTCKVLWNALVPHYLLPSLYFEEATLLPARLFRLAYGQGSYADLINNYHTDYLPLFGTLFISTGYFSLPILSLFGYVTSFIYRQFPRDNVNCLFFYKIIFVYCFISSLFAMGIATMFIEYIQCFLLPAALFFLLQGLLNCRVLKKRLAAPLS